MPEDMINVLINMDAGSNSLADPHEGPGATTSVILDAGHVSDSFVHGRGVRQGSVGGPIKWVVFMHFWLLWIKRSTQDKGHCMQHHKDTVAETEILAQMFVDDSIWLTRNTAASQEMLRRCDMFCAFHGIIINRDKSEYLTMNDTGQQIRWIPSAQHPIGEPMNRTGTHGKAARSKDKPDGRTFKYLGVHFDILAGWTTQRRKLQEKHGGLIANLKYATITPHQALYSINNKIIPAILYPLQVASVPKSMLAGWDKKHRAILRRVAALPKSVPTQIFHLPWDFSDCGTVHKQYNPAGMRSANRPSDLPRSPHDRQQIRLR